MVTHVTYHTEASSEHSEVESCEETDYVCSLKPGNIFGMSMFSEQDFPVTVTTTTPCVLITLSKQDYENFVFL